MFLARLLIPGYRILAMTALAMPGDRERCLEAGATRYLTKPLSARTLHTVLVQVVGGDREAQQA
jgi:CheY-like chemotaxis protein